MPVVELPWIFDGWSVRVDDNGTMHNRWNRIEYPGRWVETQQWIDAQDAGVNSGAEAQSTV